jgi:DNA-binding transcriptional regulator of glucitol operon
MDRIDALLIALALASVFFLVLSIVQASHYSAAADTLRNQPAREAAYLAEFGR